MEESTLTIYESYFENYENWYLPVHDLVSHNCFFCKNGKKNRLIYHCKQDMVKFIIMYLNHLKVYRCSWTKVKYFINSVKISKFCDENVIGKWLMEYWSEKDVYILICF